MIHLDRNPADLDPNQNSNLISSPGDHHSSSTTAPTHSFRWPEAIHDRNDPHTDYAALHDSIRSSDALLDFAVAKDKPPSPQQRPTHDVVHEDKSSPLSPAPDSASPNHDSKDLPQQPVQPKVEPPSLDKGELDVPREGTLTPLTELSPAAELDDDSEKKDDDENNQRHSPQFNSGSSLRDDIKRDTKVKGDAPFGTHVNGISSSSSSRSIGSSPVRHQPPSTPSAFQNASDLRLAEKFAASSHSPAPSSEFMTSSMIHAPHNMPPPNMAHASNNAKVIRILELNAELFQVCLEFQARGVPIADLRFQQYSQRLQSNLTWLAAAADQRHHHPSVALPIMTPPTAVEFSPARLQRLYSDMPELFSKEIARRKMHNANVNVPSSHPHPNQTPHTMSPSNGPMHLKRNRPDDVPDLSTSKRRDVGDGKMHASSASPSSVSPNPMISGAAGMPSIPASGPGHGPGPGSGQSPSGHQSLGMNPGAFLASGMGATGSAGLRASPPDTFSGSTSVGGVAAPGTPGIPQSPTVSASSNTGMPHPSPAGMPGIGTAGISGMQGGTGTVAIPSSAPGAPPNLSSFGTGDPTTVANLRRLQAHQMQAREQQIRQQHQQAAQMQHMQQMQQTQGGAAAPSRHMSPPTSVQAPQSVGGVGGGAGAPSNQPQQPGPSQQAQIQQLMQILQNPNHPLMVYIMQHVPNFSAFPLPQQLQKLQAFQQMVAQRNQQAATAAAQRNHQLGGISSNAGMAGGLSNGTMTGGSGNGGGPSPVSPLGQQAPVMSQPQQMSSQQSSQNGVFQFGQPHGSGGGTGIDPRMAGVVGGSNFSHQMPGNMGNVNINQQRQLMLMQQQQQQQQQMRNMNGNLNMSSGGVSAASMMGSQQYGTYGMNPRMMGQLGVSSQQQQPQPPQPPGATGAGGGSPMGPTNDTFPALRSNSTIPGIARSTRSPSDGVHSPMTPRAPSRLSHQQTSNDYHTMLQQQQHAQSAFNQGVAWSQGAQTQMGMAAVGQVNGYAMGGSMNSPNGIGGGFFGGSPSPSSQSWQHGGGMAGIGGYGYGHGQSTMGGGGQRPPDPTRSQIGRGGTPVPQSGGGGSAPPTSATQNMSPIGPDFTGSGEYDIFNPYVNGQ
ncbi:hypothetical protein BKA82DRAFT_27385 [Pisolithus tinctorius]|nr:hypothetical protein BKA82DRAFT_27385 [Pisolithus tinctorius]